MSARGSRSPELILVDTSVWVKHLRGGFEPLITVLRNDLLEVATHEMILAELILSGLTKKHEQYSLIAEMTQLPPVASADLLVMIEARKLHGQGIGFVDANLLASAIIAGAQLMTLDKKLARAAESNAALYLS